MLSERCQPADAHNALSTGRFRPYLFGTMRRGEECSRPTPRVASAIAALDGSSAALDGAGPTPPPIQARRSPRPGDDASVPRVLRLTGPALLDNAVPFDLGAVRGTAARKTSTA
jgi:hypothetical protein